MLIFDLNYSVTVRHFSHIVVFFAEISSLFKGKKVFLTVLCMLIARVVVKKGFQFSAFRNVKRVHSSLH